MKNRRRLLNVDRIFQRRLLLIFFGWNLVVVLAYFVFYIVHLKSLFEENIYRAHIQVTNLTEIFAGEFFQFSLILAGVAVALLLIFYLSFKRRNKAFFYGVKRALQSRTGASAEKNFPAPTAEEFADFNSVLQDFFRGVDENIEEERKRISQLKNSINK